MKAYGAEAYPGLEKIGGGKTYSKLLTPADCGNNIVTTLADFMSEIKVANNRIWLGAFLNVGTSYLESQIAKGVVIASDLTGGLNFTATNTRYIPLLYAGVNNHIIGIRLHGPWEVADNPDDNPPFNTGIRVVKGMTGVVIESNEIWGWPYAAIEPDSDTKILFNYLHHNQRDGIGYGIGHGTNSNTLVMGNFIDYSRHHIEGTRGTPGVRFELVYNIFGAHCTNTQIDCHGGHDLQGGVTQDYSVPAGHTLLVHHNTSLCTSQRFVGIRGYPVNICDCHHNWTYYTAGSPCAGLNCPKGWVVYAQVLGAVNDWGAKQPYVRMTEHDNWYGPNPPPNTSPATGDLDIKTIPAGAAITVDGQPIGVTQPGADLVVEVDAGSHTISFGDLAGYNTPATQTVNVPADTVVYITATYTPSSVVTAGAPAVVAFAMAVGMILIGKELK